MTSKPQPDFRAGSGEVRPILCVELEGAVLATDMLLESALHLVKRDLRNLFCILWWAFGGKACLKRKLAERADLNPSELPYRDEMLRLLRAEKSKGARLVLLTGGDERLARRIAAYLGIFDGVSGATPVGAENRTQELVARCGRARRVGPLIAALRIHQWPKNLLVWIPLFLSHKIRQPELIARGVLAMLAFCFCASAVYLVNDLLDLAADRAHPRKSKRPFASGELPLRLGMVLAPCLAAVAIFIAILLPPAFLWILLFYSALSSAYSFAFKEQPILDVCILGGLYVVRIFAGGAAMGIAISSWTLGYTMFLFLSLALLKRYVELLMLNANQQTAARGRGYVVADYPILAGFGAGSGCVAALLLALYIESDEVRLLYSRPELLWLICGIHMYWISRAWLLANRGEMHHDPVLFALRDRASYIAGLAAAAVALLAT